MINETKINPIDFFKKFIERTNDIPTNIYKTNKTFTTNVFKKITSILKGYNSKIVNEYYRIDTYGWEQQYNKPEFKELYSEAQKSKLIFHCWSPVIAIEHENDGLDWLDELVKLAYVRCPLKVVISYNDKIKTNEANDNGIIVVERDDKSKLEVASKLLQSLLYSDKDEDHYLIILGTSGQSEEFYESQKQSCNGKLYNSKYCYKGYLFNRDSKEFQEIVIE